MFRTTMVCLALVLVSGCMTTDAVYPVSWAGRVKLDSKECPNLDGEYRNLGDLSTENEIGRFSLEPESVSLAHLLAGRAENQERLNFTRGDATTDEHRSVSLRIDGGTLRVIARRADGSRRAFEIPVGRKCSGSMIDAGAAWDGSTTLLASAVDRSSMKLGRTEDGALLIRTSQSLGFFVTYIPVFGTRDERWVRFPLFMPESPSAETAAVAATL